MRWVLRTETSMYAVSLGLSGSALVLDYFGPAADPVPHWQPTAMPPVMSTDADYAPVEYAAFGTRAVHDSELIVEYDDGARGSRFTYRRHDLAEAPGATHLTVHFADERGLELSQHLLARTDTDVVERWVTIRDTRQAGEPIRLARAFSGALCVSAAYGARLEYRAGSWMREMQPQRVDLHLGTLRIGSRQGVTGHLFAPMMAVSPLSPAGDAADADAGTFGIALAWSGSWAMSAEAQPTSPLTSAPRSSSWTTVGSAAASTVTAPWATGSRTPWRSRTACPRSLSRSSPAACASACGSSWRP